MSKVESSQPRGGTMRPAEATRLSRAVGETLFERLSVSEGSEFGSPRRKPEEPRVAGKAGRRRLPRPLGWLL
jgi:hypothetical protein